ncbi:MAG: ComF family protein [Patescibacteria group bacterium]
MFDFLAFLFPTRCVSCGKGGSLLCPDCESRLPVLENLPCIVCDRPAVAGVTHPICRARYTPERFLAAFPYRGPARKLVQALKYRRVRKVAGLMADLLISELTETGVSFGGEAIVVPIPLSFWRQGARGFNQSTLLGKALAEKLSLSFRDDILRKTRDTLSQVSLNRPERSANIRSAFAVKEKLNGEDILLVDDVVTTGATAREAARELKKAGSGQVWVIAFAKD